MTADREQIRQDAKDALKPRGHWVGDEALVFARHCLALLTELDQAEKHAAELEPT